MAICKHVFIAHRWDYSNDYNNILACLIVSNRPVTGNSDWVKAEVDYARSIGTPVIAVKCTESTASWIYV